MKIEPDPETLARFSAAFEMGSPSDCWEWNRGCDKKNGYGKFSYEGKGWRAHRVSWLFNRGPIPDGMLVCHTCDNPPCVNPDHLFLGTAGENMRDAHKKGRMTALYSEEATRKRVALTKGRKRTKETKKKMSESAKKRWLRSGYRETWSVARIGQKRSAESCARMSEAARRRKRSPRRDPNSGRYLPDDSQI